MDLQFFSSYTLLGCNVYPDTDELLLGPPVWTLVGWGEYLLSLSLCANGDGIDCALICTNYNNIINIEIIHYYMYI